MTRIDYFINKFKNTRDDKWTTHDLIDSYGNSCAHGWCGTIDGENATNESMELERVLSPLHFDGIFAGTPYRSIAAFINNGCDIRYQQYHPKQRILAALRDIKKMNEEQEVKRSVASKETSGNILSETQRKNLPTSTIFYEEVEEKLDSELSVVQKVLLK